MEIIAAEKHFPKDGVTPLSHAKNVTIPDFETLRAQTTRSSKYQGSVYHRTDGRTQQGISTSHFTLAGTGRTVNKNSDWFVNVEPASDSLQQTL